jgi:dTDP-4-amino-4,6-dideoxygalactose transaminase
VETALQIPRVDLAAQREALGPELDAAIERVLQGGRFILGPEVEAFEAEFAEYCGVSHCVATGSGTDALRLVLEESGIGAGDEVATVSHTAVPTVFAVALSGATPVFVDVDPETHTMDPEHAARAIGPATRALLPVHLYGQCADMDPLRALADEHGLLLLEDACQAHGARYRGRRAGALGDAACFSFYPTKNLGAYGDGGAVVTGDAPLADRLRRARNHGLTGGYVHHGPAGNSRLDELQAAILRVLLGHLDEWAGGRRAAARHYEEAGLGELVGLPRPAAGTQPAWHLYVVRHPQVDALAAALAEAGIGTKVYYRTPVHRQPAMRELARGVVLPVTEELAETHLAIPMSAVLTRAQADEVVAATRVPLAV